jgi:restriction endonuclease Mrr
MELKQEIVQIVDKLPNEVLSELLQYLRQVEKTTVEKMRLSLNLKTILTEDRELLEKLAK